MFNRGKFPYYKKSYHLPHGTKVKEGGGFFYLKSI